MLRHLFILLSVWIVFIFIGCTEVIYDNPLDINGNNRSEIIKNGDSFDDEDGDGVPNIVDKDWSKYPKDGKPPVITLHGEDTVSIMVKDEEKMLSMYTDVTNPNIVTAKDSGSTSVKIECRSQVDVFTINDKNNPYKIIYIATDLAGNSDTAYRYVNIVNEPIDDHTPPTLQIGDTLMYLKVGQSFIDPGAYAYDLGDGAKCSVTVAGKVDTSTEGTYKITYTTEDSKHNTATAVRTVIVNRNPVDDITPPVITLLGKDTLKLAEGQKIDEFKATFVDPGFTAYDDVDKDLTNKVTVSDITYQTPKYYYIDYSVQDAAGNNVRVRRYIMTNETADKFYPPTITLVYGDSVIQINKGGSWVEPGFLVTDVQDGTIPKSQVIVDSSNLVANLGTLGTYYVTYKVTNSVGMETIVKRTVQVVLSGNDRTPPVITLLGRNPDTVLVQSKEYKEPGYTAEDDRDGDITSLVTRSGEIDFARLGKYSLLYTVTDNAKNKSAPVTRIVWVVPDTATTDLLVRYNVPSPDPLPSVKGTYTTFNTDGDGPDLSKTILTDIEWTWIHEENNTQFQFYMKYSASPYHIDLSSSVKNFLVKPQITLSGTHVEGLDGKYYVTVIEKMLVWVKIDGSFAIRLTK